MILGLVIVLIEIKNVFKSKSQDELKHKINEALIQIIKQKQTDGFIAFTKKG